MRRGILVNLNHILKKWEYLIYSLANIVSVRKITGDLVNTELSEILPDLSEFKRELQEISAEKWLNILENAGNILGIQF